MISIVISGPAQSGKTTLAWILHRYLRAWNFNVELHDADTRHFVLGDVSMEDALADGEQTKRYVLAPKIDIATEQLLEARDEGLPPKCRACGHLKSDHSDPDPTKRYCTLYGCTCKDWVAPALPQAIVSREKRLAEAEHHRDLLLEHVISFVKGIGFVNADADLSGPEALNALAAMKSWMASEDGKDVLDRRAMERKAVADGERKRIADWLRALGGMRAGIIQVPLVVERPDGETYYATVEDFASVVEGGDLPVLEKDCPMVLRGMGCFCPCHEEGDRPCRECDRFVHRPKAAATP